MSVSVIIPAYNRATLLLQTLESVLAQTSPPDEVIVVDDGSTDGTAAVARGYGDRVGCIVTANAGDLAARNTGLRAARGRLVAFCDSDDLWHPTFLATMRQLWTFEPATRAACSDFVLVRDGVWQNETKFATAPPSFFDGLRLAPTADMDANMGVFDSPLVERMIGFQPFFPSCLVADRDAFLAVGGWDEAASRTIGSDLATMLRLAEHPPFGVIRQPLVGIRKHPGNYSADVQAMNLGDARILDDLLATRPSLQPLADTIRASVESRRLAALDTAFARRDFAAVGQIATLLRRPAPRAAAAKARVAALPQPWRGVLAETLLAVGSVRRRVAGGEQSSPTGSPG